LFLDCVCPVDPVADAAVSFNGFTNVVRAGTSGGNCLYTANCACTAASANCIRFFTGPAGTGTQLGTFPATAATIIQFACADNPTMPFTVTFVNNGVTQTIAGFLSATCTP
uniref:Choice-of-anchor D domain-containing protein n=1 Tax=Enterobius vermicularis TaxID=51028 RepID=A0A0N4VGG6_ENTVE